MSKLNLFVYHRIADADEGGIAESEVKLTYQCVIELQERLRETCKVDRDELIIRLEEGRRTKPITM